MAKPKRKPKPKPRSWMAWAVVGIDDSYIALQNFHGTRVEVHKTRFGAKGAMVNETERVIRVRIEEVKHGKA